MNDFLDQFDQVPASQKLLLLLLLVAGLFVAFYLLVYSTTQEKIQTETTRLQELNQNRAELVANADDVDRLRSEIEELCRRQETFVERLPPSAEVPSLLQSIHQQARFVGLEIQRFSREDDVPDVNYTRIPVEMQVTGTYDQVADFFYFLGQQQRIVNVSDISMGMPAGPQWIVIGDDEIPEHMREAARLGPPQLNVSYEISTYYANAASFGGNEACANY